MSFTALYFFKILNRPYACFREPRFSDIFFQRVRTFTYFTWEFFWCALLWEFTAPNLHEIAWNGGLGPVSRKSRELFGPEKPFLKLPPAYSVKPVFWYNVKGILFKLTAKFRASRRLSFEDTKGNMSPEISPKSFGTFEKRAPGLADQQQHSRSI